MAEEKKVQVKKEIAQVGDVVIIEECRPLSHDKRFRLVQIIKKGESKWLKQKNLVVADNSGSRAVRDFVSLAILLENQVV